MNGHCSTCDVEHKRMAQQREPVAQARLDALQSQAERIKELESEVEMWKATANAVVDFEKVQLRAEIAAIAATEPVLIVEKEPDYWSGGHFHEGSKSHIKPTKVWCLPVGTKLFTRPMPAESKDAERYRWLREQHWSTDTIAVVLNPKQAVKLGHVCPSDSLLDETIDAAIVKGAK